MINGNKFQELADYVIDIDNPVCDSQIKNYSVIFCKSEYFNLLFKYLNKSNNKHILITGLSDKTINEKRFLQKAGNITRWFAVNAAYEHKDLIPIPLGIENHKGSSKGGYTDHNWLNNNVDTLRNKNKSDIVYCNFRIETNRLARKNVLQHIKSTGLKLRIEKSNLDYETYCRHMSECKYVLCPPGNGIDTHRLWEALYLGCIPITIKSNVFNTYNLPIVQVESFDSIQHLPESRDMKYEQLSMFYWKNLIENEKNNLCIS